MSNNIIIKIINILIFQVKYQFGLQYMHRRISGIKPEGIFANMVSKQIIYFSHF